MDFCEPIDHIYRKNGIPIADAIMEKLCVYRDGKNECSLLTDCQLSIEDNILYCIENGFVTKFRIDNIDNKCKNENIEIKNAKFYSKKDNKSNWKKISNITLNLYRVDFFRRGPYEYDVSNLRLNIETNKGCNINVYIDKYFRPNPLIVL
ncbi:hypothetical protein PIROE2DRAFT_9685 [Piromyces sp. E2]|nr:hypothetical protein PIROE2DRAFT_9685 [Piromyces sp. E2]|eukprot:OUM63745.1 hypothetical protein PIROE2DRAFT_9685 [Piromyces sp. E2]